MSWIGRANELRRENIIRQVRQKLRLDELEKARHGLPYLWNPVYPMDARKDQMALFLCDLEHASPDLQRASLVTLAAHAVAALEALDEAEEMSVTSGDAA